MKLAFLRRNIGYKVFALLLSIMLHYIASVQLNPRVTRDQYVQPEITQLPTTLVIKERPALIQLSISGTESQLAQIDRTPLTAVIDGTLMKPGLNRLPVTISLPEGISLNNPTLPLAQLSAALKEKQQYSVDVDFGGTPPAGQEYADAIAKPASVVVQGLSEDLKRIGRIVASVEKEANERTVERSVDLYAEDSQRRRVEGVEIVPGRVQVRVNLRPAPITKIMLLSVKIDGKLEPGYRIANYEVSPSQIVVRGTVEALSARSSIPLTVDVTGVMATVTKTVTVKLPPGMSPQEALPPIQVRLIVEPIPTTEGEIAPPVSLSSVSPSPTASPSPAPSVNAP